MTVLLVIGLFVIGFVTGALGGWWLGEGLEKRAKRYCPVCRGTVWMESMTRVRNYYNSPRDILGRARDMGMCQKHVNDYVALQYQEIMDTDKEV